MPSQRVSSFAIVLVACGGQRTVTAPATEAVAGPVENAPLERVGLVHFLSREKACQTLQGRAGSLVFREHQEPGSTVNIVRTVCAVRGSLVELVRTTSFPRHDDVDSVAAAIAFPTRGTNLLVAIEGIEESNGMQSMPFGDAPGSVEVTMRSSVEDGLEIFVLSVAENPHHRTDLVVCDPKRAWCTRPVTLDRIAGSRGDAWEARTMASHPYEYSFRRHPRGVVVLSSGDPRVPDRLFPLVE